MARSFAREVAPEGPKEPPPVGSPEALALAAQTPPDPDLPFTILELPHMRYLQNKDGSKVDAFTMAITNGDKIGGIFKEIVAEVRGMVADSRKAQDGENESRQQQLEHQEKQIAQAARLVAILERKTMIEQGKLPADATGVVPEPVEVAPPPAPTGGGVPQGARKMADTFAAWGTPSTQD